MLNEKTEGATRMIAEKVKMPKLSKKAKKRIITCTVIAAAAVVIFMMIRSGGKGVGGVPTMTLEPKMCIRDRSTHNWSNR